MNPKYNDLKLFKEVKKELPSTEPAERKTITFPANANLHQKSMLICSASFTELCDESRMKYLEILLQNGTAAQNNMLRIQATFGVENLVAIKATLMKKMEEQDVNLSTSAEDKIIAILDDITVKAVGNMCQRLGF